MNPLKITLTGFKGIQAGMGLQTYTLDLTQFSDAQLVAIIGPNGRGKTTIIDNLQPFRLMASKITNANYSPEAFSFFDHLVGPGDASKELIWEHDGETYRSLLEWKIREKTQSTAAYLQYRDGDNWLPVTLLDGTSSDGKAKTYDRCVETILGSPRLYFTAAFSAQGRSQLSSYKQGDIKGLMSEVLNLNEITALGEKAGEVRKGLQVRLDDRRGKLSALDTIRAQAAELTQLIEANGRLLNDIHLPAIIRHSNTVTIERGAVMEMQLTQQDAVQLRARRDAVQQQITAAGAEYEKVQGEIQADIKAEDDQHQQALKRIDTTVQQLNASITRHEQRKTSAEALLAQRELINTAIDALPALREQVTKAEEAVTQAQTAVNEASQAKNSLDALDRHIKTLVDAGKAARSVETSLQTTCALSQEVPCQGTDLQGRCKLLTDALTAKEKLPAAQADIAAKTKEFHEANDKKAEFATLAATLAERQAALSKAQTALKAAQQLVTDNEKLAAKAEGLVSAEAALTDAESCIAGDQAAIVGQNEQRAEAIRKAVIRTKELHTRLDAAATANQATMQRLQTELDRIPQPEDDTALKAAEQRLADAQKAEQEARDAADRCRGAIATAEGRLQGFEEQLAAGEKLGAEIAHLEAEIAHWTLLGKALGRDGILALSIDDAGPTLASLANDLLLSCYGPRFSVRIDTQETVKTTGAQKETFDITVFDSESDTSKSVSEMSGGERIWINEALTRAIALYQARASGKTFGTLFSDESDGALDAEKKTQFVQMKREVLKLGGYAREFFISHSPDVWPLADAVIQL